MERSQLAIALHSNREGLRLETESEGAAEFLPQEWNQVSCRRLHLQPSHREVDLGGGGLRRAAGENDCRWSPFALLR